MIKIMTTTKGEATTITVDGRLTGEYVDALDSCVKQAVVNGSHVHLFLRDVSTIDEQGMALLGRVAKNGVRLSATGIYSSYIVSRIGPSAVRS